MSFPVVYNGVTYIIPEYGDEGWGPDVTSYLNALATGALTRSGGLFALLNDVDFGGTYGLKAAYFGASGTGVADSGFIRMPTDQSIAWRNSTNSTNNLLAVDSLDQLTYNGIVLATGGGSSAVWGLITGTLANQTDLQAALDLKAPIASPTFTGTVTVANLTVNTGLRAPGVGYMYGNGTGSNVTFAADLPASSISGTLPVGHGGSGATTLTGFLKGNGASPFTAQAAISLTTDVAGVLPITNGGTGANNATGALNALLPAQSGATLNYALTSGDGATLNPKWSQVPALDPGVTQYTYSPLYMSSLSQSLARTFSQMTFFQSGVTPSTGNTGFSLQNTEFTGGNKLRVALQGLDITGALPASATITSAGSAVISSGDVNGNFTGAPGLYINAGVQQPGDGSGSVALFGKFPGTIAAPQLVPTVALTKDYLRLHGTGGPYAQFVGGQIGFTPYLYIGPPAIDVAQQGAVRLSLIPSAPTNLLWEFYNNTGGFTPGTSGQVLTSQGPLAGPIWATVSGGGGSGTVSSISVAAGSSKLSSTGSPITTAGTITLDVVEGNLNIANMTGTLPVTRGGTNATTSDGALTNLLPSQGGNSGKVLTTNGVDTSWGTSVTSVIVSGTAGRITSSGSPITSAGTISLDLATVGTPGTYTSVTTDAYGRVTAGTNPATTVAWGNITGTINNQTDLKNSFTALGTATLGTGVSTLTDTVGLTAFSNTVLRINAVQQALFYNQISSGGIAGAVRTFAQQDWPLSNLATSAAPITVDGIYTRFIGYDQAGVVQVSTSTYVGIPSVLQIGYIVVVRTAGVISFLDGTAGPRNVFSWPDFAGNTATDDTFNAPQTTVRSSPNANLTVLTGAGVVKGQSINWGTSNVNETPVVGANPASFIVVNPTTINGTTLPAPTTAAQVLQYYRTTAPIGLTNLAGGQATVQRLLITLRGVLFWQVAESNGTIGAANQGLYANLGDATSAMPNVVFTEILPKGTSIEIARVATLRTTTNLADNAQAAWFYPGAGSGGGSSSSATGTVTSVGASGTQGVTVSGVPITSTGTIAIGLDAITPTSVAATGSVTGSNLSGTNTGDRPPGGSTNNVQLNAGSGNFDGSAALSFTALSKTLLVGSDTGTGAVRIGDVTLSGVTSLSINAAISATNLSGTNTGDDGTVKSVGLALTGSLFTVSGSPVTATGTLTGTLNTQPQNSVFAGQISGVGVPTFRALVAADVPTLNQNTTGTAAGLSSTLAITSGGTGQTSKAPAFDALAPTIAKGDLIVRDSSSNNRVTLGGNNQVLTVDTTTATGVKWATPASVAPGGSTNSVQINNGGSFQGYSGFTYTPTQLLVAPLTGTGAVTINQDGSTIGNLTIVQPDGLTSSIGAVIMRNSSNNNLVFPAISTSRSRGTAAAPQAVTTGDRLGGYTFSGHDGSTYQPSAVITAIATETFGVNLGSQLVFSTKPTGAPGANFLGTLAIEHDNTYGLLKLINPVGTKFTMNNTGLGAFFVDAQNTSAIYASINIGSASSSATDLTRHSQFTGGGAGQVLTSAGNGTFPTWTTVSGGSGSPGGVDGNIQYNALGSFGGNSQLNWVPVNGIYTQSPPSGTGSIILKTAGSGVTGTSITLVAPDANTGADTMLSVTSSSNTASAAPLFAWRRSRGTAASPTAIQNADTIGYFSFSGHDGVTASAYSGAATITCNATETWTSLAHGANIAFALRPTGSTTSVSIGRYRHDGTVAVYELPVATGTGYFTSGPVTWRNSTGATTYATINQTTASGAPTDLTRRSEFTGGTAGQVLTSDGSGTNFPTFTTIAGNASANVGYLNIPQNSQVVDYTTVLGDSGKHIFHPSTDTNSRVFIIASNAAVPYPIGTAITFVNMSANIISVAINTDTMYLAGAGTTGIRNLAQYGSATALKLTATTWLISGTNLT